ncbi:MBL fold metallo-hydrolase [Bacillus sp. ISL-75]|uniref:MBL fold metallo-hydrolase n=1 Tax=Bacillus sp. ISL-75 TaxID=2819137 RepID=UPI001BED16E9|nr:MBL fold metallo-hydrolase [Bacillus sp. ISL-75]MBT2729567.1 MBL fold metallo-hydrolase [Bacillus sp. ISL-75]
MDLPGSIQRIKYYLTDKVFVNSYIITGTTFSILIDSGVVTMKNQYLQLIEDLNKTSKPLKLLINTHAHHDHIGCNNTIQHNTGCLIMAPMGSEKWIENIDLNYEEFALPFPHIHPDSNIKRGEIYHSMDGNSKVNLLAQEGDVIRIDDLELIVISLPGHIDHELGLIELSTKTLILGDIIVRTDIPIFPGHLRPSQLRKSLQKIENILDQYSIERVLTGHFNPMSKEETIQQVHKVYDYLSTIDEIILKTLESHQKACLQLLWSNVCEGLNKEKEFRAISLVHHHLLDLMESGQIEKLNEKEEVYWRKKCHLTSSLEI